MGNTPTIRANTGSVVADALVVKAAPTASSVSIQQSDDLVLLVGTPASQLAEIVGGPAR